MSLQPDLRRLAVAATLVCMTVMSIGAPATATPSSSTVTVSGQSVEQVIFSVRDPADDVTAFVDEGGLPGAHVCYALGGEITVSSNVAYDLLASDAAATQGLHFMAESPASYAACADGEPVSDTVFATTDLPGRWAVR